MRISVCTVLAAIAAWGILASGCDKGEVLLDETQRTVYNDSTSIRAMECVPDSTEIIINTTSDWTAAVAKGSDWCTISKEKGRSGRDTIVVFVAENPTAVERQTSVIYESGTVTRIFRVVQKAGEPWFEVMYWKRTAAQRMGLRGKVESIYETDRKNPNDAVAYKFDARGNLVSRERTNQVFDRYDTTTTYTYDDDNHRLTCTVKVAGGVTLRKWKYEYANTGQLVAYSARGWNDPDPLAERMDGMVVPDLSAVYGYSSDKDFEYGEEHLYSFDESGRLVIMTHYWKRSKESPADSIPTGGDTLRVEYRNGLPYTSRFVTNSTYYKDKMLKMMDTRSGRYEFLENTQRLIPVSFRCTNAAQLADKEVEWFECTYNFNKDMLERRVQYHGVDFVTVEQFSKYEYDDRHNWMTRLEYIPQPGFEVAHNNIRRRAVTYFR